MNAGCATDLFPRWEKAHTDNQKAGNPVNLFLFITHRLSLSPGYSHGKASRHAATTARGLLLFFEDAQAAIGVDHDFTPIFPYDGEKHSASAYACIVSDGHVFYS